MMMPERDPLRRLRAALAHWMAVGALGAALITIGGVVVGPGPLNVAHALPAWLGYTLAYTGVALLVAAWLALGISLRSSAGPDAKLLRTTMIVWAAPIALGAPIYSRDVYSYAAQGRLANLGLNPYLHGPDHLGGGPYLDAVGHLWTHTHAPYGPFFIWIAAFVTRVTPSLTAAVYGLRAVELLGVGLLVVFVPRLARVIGVDERVALWLAVLNPIALVHLVGGAHNDAVMLGLLVAGLALAGEGNAVAGLVLCTLAAAVKVPAGLGVLYVAVDWVAATQGLERQKRAIQAAAISLGTFTLMTGVAGFGWGWIGALGTPGRVHTLLSPVAAIGSVLGDLARAVHPQFSGSVGVTIARFVGAGAAIVVLAVLFSFRHRYGTTRVLAVSLLAVVLLGPVVQPWYLLWAIVLLGAAGPGRLRPAVIWLSATLPFLVLPNGSIAADPILAVFLVVTGAVVWVTFPRRQALVSETAFEA